MDTRPFHLKHPELHLKPISEFEKLFFWFNKPEYVEDPSEAEDSEYLFIARGGNWVFYTGLLKNTGMERRMFIIELFHVNMIA